MYDQSAPVVALDLSLPDLAGFMETLCVNPVLLLSSTMPRDDDVALLVVLGSHNVDRDFVTDRYCLDGVRADAL